MEHPKTIKIKRDGELFTINEDDYNEERDGKPVKDDGAEVVTTAPATFPPAPGLVIPPAPSAPSMIDPVAPVTVTDRDMSVIADGTGKSKKFYVVFAKDASRVIGYLDIDEEGYKTDGEAWAAIRAVQENPARQFVTPPANAPTADDIQAAADAAKE